MSKTIGIIVDDKMFVINVTYEGIIIDMYDEDGEEFIDSPFAVMWNELLPDEELEEENEEDKVST